MNGDGYFILKPPRCRTAVTADKIELYLGNFSNKKIKPS